MTAEPLRHSIHGNSDDPYDVFIAGSGPIGATFARQLVDKGHNVVMVEMGEQDTSVPGGHKKNDIQYQKDIDRFVRVIQGSLSKVSIPVSSTVIPELDPAAWTPKDPKKQIISNGRNPFQEEHNNLGGEAVTRAVGGMSTHWTCATPEFLKRSDSGEVFERPVLFDNDIEDDNEWNLLYNAARSMIGTSEREFEYSIRHNIVFSELKSYIDKRNKELGKIREVKPLPLACHRHHPDQKASPYVQWHAADHVFGDLFDYGKSKKNANGGKFTFLPNTLCKQLVCVSPSTPSILYALVNNLRDDHLGVETSKESKIFAKIFVIAAGAVATPQILANSGFGGKRVPKENELIPNLARYITEQPMTFCQVVLYRDLVEAAGKNLDEKPPWWRAAVVDHRKNNPEDPLPIPYQDGEPQVMIPASHDFPWHIQIHRDAFSYGEAGPRVDSRVVVDFRFFGRQDGQKENRIIFEEKIKDAYGMPQPTFQYEASPELALEASRMMRDMTDIAHVLGGYLPGSYPQFMVPGLALHLGGTTRLGRGNVDKEFKESVADYNSQVWKFDNLYVGGNGLIPTAFAANPTLTSMCFAIRAAYKINKDLTQGKLTPPNREAPERTPEQWVRWTKEK